MASTEFFTMFEALCAEHGMSVRAACVKMGISTASQTNWRRGYLPSAKNQAKIADFFNISVDELMQRDTDKTGYTITDQHVDILEKLNMLSAEDKEFVLRIIDLLSKYEED